MRHEHTLKVNPRTQALLEARTHDPFAVLGMICNSDSRFFGGSDCGNDGAIVAEPIAWMGRPCSAAIILAPEPPP